MKKVSKSVFFIIAILIAVMGYFTVVGLDTRFGDVTTRTIKGVDDIRWGIDVRGGVDVTFSPPEGVDATDEEMSAAESVIGVRLVAQNITDYELYTDYQNDRIIVRFPWKADEKDFNPEEAIRELGETAHLTFREMAQQDPNTYAPSGVTADNIVIEGLDIENASANFYRDDKTGVSHHIVSLKLTSDGAKKFADATTRLSASKSPISIWMDDHMISAPIVNDPITNGEAMITGGSKQNSDGTTGFTRQEAMDLANKINSGALPFKLVTENYNTISPTLGSGAKDAMVLAGGIAFAVIAVIMIVMYRLPGFVAVIALLGQLIIMLASLTGFFSVFPSFTLTLPGIAGIILAIGFGVDANIITAERIKEEIYNGRSVGAAINAGFSRAFSAILDSNVTVIIVAVILMGSFGPPESIFAKLLSPVFFMFGPSAAGAIYSFGYTLLVGVILNLLMGVFASRLMLTSLSGFSCFKNPKLYGGKNND